MGRRSNNPGIQSRFMCCKCGREGLSVWRPQSATREAGHLKKLYCPYCGEEVNHVEISPRTNYTVSDFKTEFDNCNFDGEGQRVQSFNELKAAINRGDLDINYEEEN